MKKIYFPVQFFQLFHIGKTFNVDTSDIFSIQNSLMNGIENLNQRKQINMINWENIRYDISNANKDFDKLIVNINEIEPINPPKEFEHLREQLIEARDSLYDEYNFDNANKLDYQFDVLFGLKLYDILRKDDNFSNRVAANDEIWRFYLLK